MANLMIGSEVALIAVLILGTLGVVLVGIIRGRLKILRHYNDSKNIVKAIIMDFQKRLKDRDQKLEEIEAELIRTKSFYEKLATGQQHHTNRLNGLSNYIEEILQNEERMLKNFLKIKEGMNKITERQAEVISNIEKIMANQTTVRIQSPVPSPAQAVANLRQTELQVLSMLTREGSKAAPDIGKVIGKSREHTARLMKKLFEEGYVDRETNRIPFRYKINEKLKDQLTKTEEKKNELEKTTVETNSSEKETSS